MHYICNDDNKTSYELDSNVFITSLLIVNSTNGVTSLGEYQLSILLTGMVNYFESQCIRKSRNQISSSMLYNNFINFLKTNEVNESIIEYISCVKFVGEFGKKYEQNRTSAGKFWKDIEIINEEKINPIGMVLHFSARKTYMHTDVINHSKDSIKYYHGYEIQPNTSYDIVYHNSCYDFTRPYKLVITDSTQTDLIKVDSIIITCNNRPICKFLIKKLWLDNLIEQNHNEYIVTLENMPYFSLYCKDELQITIVTNNASKLKFELVNEFTLYNGDERYPMVKIPQYAHSFCKLSYNGSDTKDITLSINSGETHEENSMIKGIMLCESIDDLCSVKLIMNGSTALIFDKLLIKTICKRLNGMLYIPFNNDSSLKKQCDMIRFDTLKVICTFNTVITSLNIYLDTFDILIYDQSQNKIENFGYKFAGNYKFFNEKPESNI